MTWIDPINLKWLPMNYKSASKSANPFKLYIVTDNHMGVVATYSRFAEFVSVVNRDKPDAVIHLGDAIHGVITTNYPLATNEDAARAQFADWLVHWNNIDPTIPKGMCMGNRDVGVDYPLDDSDWVTAFGMEANPLIGGTKLQRSWIVDNGDVRVLFIAMSYYTVGLQTTETYDWVADEMENFDGDQIIVMCHNQYPYKFIKDRLIQRRITTPSMYLHGHYHPYDTLVRDMHGEESDGSLLSFPIYCLTHLFSAGMGASLELHLGGFPESPQLGGYHKFQKINTTSLALEDAIYHYQTKVV